MPNYVYRCPSCQNQYEKHEGFDAPARQPCPNCGQEAKRVLFAPPIVFKGSGFYITDSRKGSNAMIAGDSSPTPTEPVPTADGPSSDAGPAAAASFKE